MDKLIDHKGFWGPAEELIDRAKRLQKVIGVNLKTISIRLVRYYASEGIIEKPDRLGREAAYHYKHLLQLLLARRLSEHGVTLADIKMIVSGQSALELEAKLKCSTQLVLDEIKRRRLKETAARATDLAIPEVTKGGQRHYPNPELDALVSQLKYVGEAMKTVADKVDTLGESNLELAAQHERLRRTFDEAHYLLRESTENQKHMSDFFVRLTERLDHTEEIARGQQIDQYLFRITNTIEQLTERIALLEGSVDTLATKIRDAKN